MAYVDKALRFNPASPVFQENLHNVYHYMRHHQPVARIGKTWVLTRYQDVYQALKERAFVSSGIPEDVHTEMEKQCFSLSPPLRGVLYGIVLFEDGNVHRAHRQALQALFTGESWAALTRLVSEESHSVVADLTAAGPFDGIRQIAAPLWGKLFTAWLNLPEAQQEVVEEEKNAIRLLLDPSAIDREGLERLIVALSRLDDSFQQLAQAHRQGYDSLFYRSLLKGYGGDRDESVFEEAGRFIPGRRNAQRQLGFGAGVHQCIGQLLAQCQAETLAMALSERGTISLDGVAKWSNRSLILRTLETLPVKII